MTHPPMPCHAEWVDERREWHSCVNDDAMHEGDHLCRCGDRCPRIATGERDEQGTRAARWPQ